MAESSVAERLGGRAFETGSHEPFLLDDPEKAFYVERGFLNLFGVETDSERRMLGRRPFVARLDPGAVTFGGAVRPRNGGDGAAEGLFALLAVPSQDAVLVDGQRARIESVEAFDLDATIWIEEWIANCSGYLVRDLGPPPPGARLLEAEPDVSYPAGSFLSAQHLDTVWVSADRPMRYMGRDELVVPPGAPPLPLTEFTWVELEEDAAVSGLYTPTVLFQRRLRDSLALFNRMVCAYGAESGGRRSTAMVDRHSRGVEVRGASAATMFGNLGSVLGAAESRGVAAATGGTPLQAAAAAVAHSDRVELALPREPDESGSIVEAVTRLVRPAGIRVREIALAPGWHRRRGPSFVGETREGAEPLAAISGDDGYRAVDGRTGESFAIDGRRAEAISDRGTMLYPPLPREVAGGGAAMLHSLRGFGPDFRTVAAMATLGGLLALVTPVLTGRLLAEVIPRVDTPMWVAFLGALFLAAFGTALFDIVRALALLRVEGRVDERLQSAVWSRLLSLSTGFFRLYSAGDLADRANGISQIRQVLTGVVTGAVISGVFSLFSFALLFYYSWALALCAGGLVTLLMAATFVFGRGQMRHLRKSFTIQGAIDGFVFQMITGISKLRIANAEIHALLRWAEKFAEQKRATLSARRWMAAQATFNVMFMPLSMIAIFAYIAFQLLGDDGEAAFGLADYLSFNAAYGQFVAAVTGLTTAWTTAISVIPLFERVQPILAATPESAAGGIDPGELIGDIEFSNVSFRYLPDAPNVVNGVTFRIRAGSFVAFVGPSGSGKSTLYRLMLGFEQPDSGSVFIDGHDLAGLDLAALRSRMGVVLQNGQTLAASIFENISGTASLTMNEAWDAARAAGLDKDIEAMPMGMHTVLPEGGVGLSGGQRQRLLIARALARKPRIILLDEATSALDNRTQAVVQASLKGISATRVVIAHRLSTVQEAEHIYVMEAGRIVEHGGYDELMEKDGAFAQLARRQLV